jgi:predicted lipoprotein with Yx(FWY)xxD motif
MNLQLMALHKLKNKFRKQIKRKMKKYLIITTAILTTILGIVSCKKESNSPGVSTPLLSLSDNAVIGGNILIDSSGRAVYNFIFDDNGVAACNGGCEVSWPHVYFANLSQNNLGQGLSISDFSTTTDIDGSMQTTFKGHPLYNYSHDTKTNGVWSVTGNNIEGGVWFAGQPDFSVFFLSPKLTDGDTTTHLTTNKGITLYTTTLSNPGSGWTAYQPTNKIINLPARLSSADFSINANGALTYNGSILYTYANDKVIGDTTGIGVTGYSLVLLPDE